MVTYLEKMETLSDYLERSIAGWSHSLGILAITLLITGLVRTSLVRLRNRNRLPALHSMAIPLSNVPFLLGLRLAVDASPIGGRIEKVSDAVLYILTIAVFLLIVQRAALLSLIWSTSRVPKSITLELGFIPLMRNVITLFVFFTGAIMILKYFHYDVLSLLTALGVGSLAVGLAAKDTLSNMISGFILIIDRNLRPGDRINLSGSVGTVKEIGLRSTQIYADDGHTLIVPNSELVNTKILNLSLPTREMSCNTQIRVPYTVAFSTVKQIALSVAAQSEKISKSKSVGVSLMSLHDGFQLIQISFWVSDLADSGNALSDFNEHFLIQIQSKNIPLVVERELQI